MAPTLNQVNLVVGDLSAALAFYRLLGVDLPESARAHADARFGDVSMDLDDADSAQWWHSGWRATPGPRVVITFRCDSREEVDALYARLTGAGHGAVQPPFDAFFGSRYAIVADPDGNDVALMSQPEPDRKYWPAVDPPPAPAGSFVVGVPLEGC